MRKTILFLTSAAAAGIIAFTACQESSAKQQKEKPVLSSAEMVKRGEYLVNIIGCDDCHSPKRMGAHEPEIIPELRLSGYPSGRPLQIADSSVIKKGWAMFGPDLTSFAGPWGMSFAANLTSDATGIGNWTEEHFITAIRKGKFKGMEEGRNLLPPMPWFVYKNMTDEDLKAVFAYLKSTKPVQNVVPAPKLFTELK
jgi:hypothetical protein